MRALDDNVYVDHWGRKHIKIRNVGYEIYGYIMDDGCFGWCGGFVGEEAGWKKISLEQQSKEDLLFRIAVEKAPEMELS